MIGPLEGLRLQGRHYSCGQKRGGSFDGEEAVRWALKVGGLKERSVGGVFGTQIFTSREFSTPGRIDVPSANGEL